MIRIFSVAIVIFLLLGSLQGQERHNKYEVNISFTGLPFPIQTKYDISENELKVYEEYYNPITDSIIYDNCHVFKKFDQAHLIHFLNKINWDTMPKDLKTLTVDGYHMDIKLKVKDKIYFITVANTYHPTIDSLLKICNEMIPKMRIRKDYKFYYEKGI